MNKDNKDLIIALAIIILVIVAVIYLVFAFALMAFNPLYWGIVGRSLFILSVGATMFFTVIKMLR